MEVPNHKSIRGSITLQAVDFNIFVMSFLGHIPVFYVFVVFLVCNICNSIKRTYIFKETNRFKKTNSYSLVYLESNAVNLLSVVYFVLDCVTGFNSTISSHVLFAQFTVIPLYFSVSTSTSLC